MRTSLRWLLVAGLALAAASFSCSKQPSEPRQQYSNAPAPLFNKTPGAKYISGEYIVVFKDEVRDAIGSTFDVEQRFGFRAQYRYSHAIKGFAGRLAPATLDALRHDPRVAYIEQNQMAHIVATQTSPTWGLNRIDQRSLPLDNSYTYNQTGAGVDVYCIDTGIRFTHVDFGGRAVKGYDAVTPGGTAADGHGHGTHTAGTIGGTTYGVAKAVRLIAVRVLDNAGYGSYAQVIDGVDWVTADHTTNPAVANMSLGGPQSSALDTAVRNSIADGVTYCVSAGNSATDASTQSPSDVTEALTVGATGVADGFAYFSNYGSVVDLEAPGVNVTSDYNTSDNATATLSGTSMSSPHVAGACALYLEAHPAATPADVQAAIVGNATAGAVSSLPGGTANRLLYAIVDTTPTVVPATPVLSSPADGVTGVPVPAALTWNSSPGARSYRVQVSTSIDFTSTVYDNAGVIGSSTSVPGLAAGTLYYWRVTATNSAGSSDWSTVWSFTTASGSPPAAPMLLSPINGANNVSRTAALLWYPSGGAASYRVQVATSPAFTTIVFDQAGISFSSTIVTGLASHSTYYWRVNAGNAFGTSGWSGTWRFRTKR